MLSRFIHIAAGPDQVAEKDGQRALDLDGLQMNLIGPLMTDIDGPTVTTEDRELLAHPSVGGVILFARNFIEVDQLRTLCMELAALKFPRLLIAVDHEGGRVQRFRQGFSRVPAMGTLGPLYAESAERAMKKAFEYGVTIGSELSTVGVDLCLAPVLDRNNGVSEVIGDRAFSGVTEQIVSLARSFRLGLNHAGMAGTGKHFPGHGAVGSDSHKELPVDRRPFDEIERHDLAIFRTLIEDGIESLMTAHVRFTSLDAQPATFSQAWINGVLRRRLRYNGAVLSDDLNMEAARTVGGMADRVRLALEAGCDMALVCNDRPGLVAVLDARPAEVDPLSSARLQRLYRTAGPR